MGMIRRFSGLRLIVVSWTLDLLVMHCLNEPLSLFLRVMIVWGVARMNRSWGLHFTFAHI